MIDYRRAPNKTIFNVAPPHSSKQEPPPQGAQTFRGGFLCQLIKKCGPAKYGPWQIIVVWGCCQATGTIFETVPREPKGSIGLMEALIPLSALAIERGETWGKKLTLLQGIASLT